MSANDIDLEKLIALKSEYLALQDDKHEYKYYASDRKLAAKQLAGFINWLKTKKE